MRWLTTRIRQVGAVLGAAMLASLAVAGPASAGSDHASDPTVGFLYDRGRVVERIRLPGQGAPFGIPVLNGINNNGKITGKAPYDDR